MPRSIANPRLTDVFDLSFTQTEVDFAIPHLQEDLPLYLDPFLLWASDDPDDHALHARILDFFECVRGQVLDGRMDQAAALLAGCSEWPALGLGYGKGTKRGSALGPQLVNGVVGAFANVPQLRDGELRHMEELQLVVPGIAEDRVSDITASILRDYLLEFTSLRARELNIPTREFGVEGIFVPERNLWRPARAVPLPYNPLDESPIVFSPLKLLRHLPWINYEDYYRSGYAPYVLGPAKSTRKVAKEAVLAYNREHYIAVERYVDERERAAASAKPDPLFQPLSLPSLRKKFETLRVLPTGKEDGNDKEYEELIFDLLSSLLYPTLEFAESRARTVSGAHIRDLIFYNDGHSEFWRDIRERHDARQPVFELKNVKALSTEHVNQLFRYLDDEFGRVGVLVTRNPTPRAVSQNIVDLHSSKRVVILSLDDSDVDLMLSLAESARDPADAIRKRYVEFTRLLPK